MSSSVTFSTGRVHSKIRSTRGMDTRRISTFNMAWNVALDTESARLGKLKKNLRRKGAPLISQNALSHMSKALGGLLVHRPRRHIGRADHFVQNAVTSSDGPTAHGNVKESARPGRCVSKQLALGSHHVTALDVVG